MSGSAPIPRPLETPRICPLPCCRNSRDLVAGDNLTLEYRGLAETEIEFEAIEPGQSMLDAFLLKFGGQIFVMLAQMLLMWSIIIGDQDRIVLDAHIAFGI